MKQKLKNNRQKARGVVIHTPKLFNALVLSFCNNPSGCCQLWYIATKKIFGGMNNYHTQFFLALYQSWLGSKFINN
jgi:hypothetical protein